ncbi:hypothetical protein SBOR_0537 [Sclerotinia borealis F-4128]|uniref:Uncharacterized protein n=1 Tax=Sclerotinia borealis (strain F-4128) TaxID=1432307 RepID=W9CQL1_SCLBF|nr:hypothetical protein SBOR_0537 [Sclerotinia borealis F-4128]
MELRDRGIASAKTRYSANGPGLWTRQASDNEPIPEPSHRFETISLSPEGKSKRNREIDNMRPKRNRAAASKMDTTNSAISSQAQIGMNQNQNHAERGRAPENKNEERFNGRESSHGEPTSSSDDGNGRRYSFSNHRNEPTFLDRIRVLPEMRDLPWRSGQSLPPEKSTDSQRVQQRGAWNQDARALRYANDPSTKRNRREAKKRPHDDDDSIFNRFNSPGHYVSPYPPLPSIPRPPLRTPGLRQAEDAELDSLLQAQIAREEFDQGNLDEGESMGNGQQARAAPIVMHRPRFYPPLTNRQLAQPIHTIPNGQITRNPIAAGSPHMTEKSLIGESSKSTQRQLFTVMSGVQGGLQQLQKELNSLKAVLGWDVEYEETGVDRRQQTSLRKDGQPGP